MAHETVSGQAELRESWHSLPKDKLSWQMEKTGPHSLSIKTFH